MDNARGLVQKHHAVMDERLRLRALIDHGPAPDELQLFDGFLIDMLDWTYPHA